jgi:hypothetical protein
MTNEQLTARIERPTVVRTGAHDLAVDHAPLATGWDAGRRDVELKRLTVHCLVIEPRKSTWPWTLGIVLGASAGNLAAAVLSLLDIFDRTAGWGLRAITVVLSVLFAAMMLFCLLLPGSTRRWLRFDRATGLFTISRRPFWLFWRPLKPVSSRPLTELVGVQVIDCGWQAYSLEIGEPGTPGSVVYAQRHGYQLNLLLNDKTEPRLNIARHSNGQWMQVAGRQLADFLNVPFFDRQAPGYGE